MKVKRKIRLQTIFLLAILLASNSFAWFIYSTKVSNSITAKVRSWSVNFEIGTGSTTEEYIEIVVDSLYPGMNDYNKYLKAVNRGESDAVISYKVETATILGTSLLNQNLTDNEIISKLKRDYPFKINFDITNTEIKAHGGEETITININWPYESGDDEKDTYWGNLAYNYHNENPSLPSIKLIVKITAIQK